MLFRSTGDTFFQRAANGEFATDVGEAGERSGECAGGFCEFTGLAVHGKGEVRTGAGGDGQRVGFVVDNEGFVDGRNLGSIESFDRL